MRGADLKTAPFLFSHHRKTAVGFLLIHGLTASPWEISEVGKAVYQAGYNVYGVRLAGHGTTLDQLDQTNFQDWIQSGKEGLDLIMNFADKIVMIGLSLGSLVALYLAESTRGNAVISISTPLRLKTSLRLFLSITRYVKKFQYRALTPDFKGYYYPKHSLRAIREMTKLAAIVRGDLEKVTQPILIMQSKLDIRVNPQSASLIYEQVSSTKKELVLFEKSDQVPHVMTTRENPLLEIILNHIFRFINAQF